MQTPLFSGKSWLAMEGSATSSTFTCSSLLTSPGPDEHDGHNMWNPMLGLFCHEQVGSRMEAYFEEVDLVRISLCVIILWMYFVTERGFTVLMGAPFGTIALGASLRWLSVVTVTTQALLVTRVRVRTTINK